MKRNVTFPVFSTGYQNRSVHTYTQLHASGLREYVHHFLPFPSAMVTGEHTGSPSVSECRSSSSSEPDQDIIALVLLGSALEQAHAFLLQVLLVIVLELLVLLVLMRVVLAVAALFECPTQCRGH